MSKAKTKYYNRIEDRFYDCILKEGENAATKIIDEALSIMSDEGLVKKKANLKSGVYSDALAFLRTSNKWETIEQSHAGPNEYCCYRISLAEKSSKVFRCYYVSIEANSLVQSGHVNSISGPVAWYKITRTGISKLSYEEEKKLNEGQFVSWDYSMTRIEKLKRLESLLSG